MYKFIDVTETQEGISLPSEALMINGEYIENLIEGYRTLTVEGREALSPELSAFDTGLRDGSTMGGKRYPARIIRVTYQLAAESNEAFREAYNKLGAILDVTDARLIFADEQDKYFTGTTSYIGEVEPGSNIVVGEFEITCFDPFKYSVMEYEATAEPGESSIMLDYHGTYKGYPILQADFYSENEDGEASTDLTGNGDCGFVAFFTEDEKIVQLGDPAEADGDSTAFTPSQTLINSKFNTEKSAAAGAYEVNKGITTSSAVVQTGTIAHKIATLNNPGTEAKSTTTTILKATSKAERPYVHYEIEAVTHNRDANGVDVNIVIKTRLDNHESYFGRGFGLMAEVVFGTVTKKITLKTTEEYWRGTTEHSAMFKVHYPTPQTVGGTISGVKFRVYRTDSAGGSTGVLSQQACADFTYLGYTAPTTTSYYLSPNSFGSGSDWHGPSVTHVLRADANGDAGATNFDLSWSQKLAIGNGANATNQYGAFQVLAVSGSGSSRKIVAGVNVYKGSAGKKAKLRFYVNNTVVETTDIDLSYSNKYFTVDRSSVISKFGKTVKFNIGGYIQREFTVSDIANLAVTEFTFTFTQFGTKPVLSYNGLYWAKFVKHNCETWKDVPNKFSSNDVVEADCKNGEILLNGATMPSLGALGNDWEGFYLTPGLNQIGTTYSDWVAAEHAPKFKVRYREVFL